MRDILKSVSFLVLTLTPSHRDASKESFPTYQIKGMCQYRCMREGDYVP